ncbi:class I SAM-dependent methyltransferase [Parvularcula sp. LCG005]|uniref:class I SAM-dependent methyltransferase n=1 Tax=Parvularcula sp. LCG005 TaxID=3078805 RepID=UPI0029436C6A|nr:methyltransferase domain-containing protein [Parvularcula sp. LCG005]WOI53969.1 methyltransferase domain-containing protein [Parvularcula sp. LCG005]
MSAIPVSTTPRFGDQAALYDQYRPYYPTALFDHILGKVTGRRLAVDLGSGTGRTLRPLTTIFDTVIAIEPDADMAAHIAPSPGLRVQTNTAETATLPAGIDLVCCGTSFHWMDGDAVLSRLAPLMAPGGALAILTYYRPDPGPAAKGVVEQEFAERWNAHKNDGQHRHSAPQRTVGDHPDWQTPERVMIPATYELSADAYAGFFATTSYGAAYLKTLDDPADYLCDLAGRLAAAAGADPMPVSLPVELVLSRPVRAGASA